MKKMIFFVFLVSVGTAGAAPSEKASLVLAARSFIAPVASVPKPPSQRTLRRWIDAMAGASRTFSLVAGEAREQVAQETAARARAQLLLPAAKASEEASSAYWNSHDSLWAMYLTGDKPVVRLGVILPMAAIAGQVEGDVDALLDRLERFGSLPRQEAVETLRRLERLRLETGAHLTPNIERMMERMIRRSKEPLDDKKALKARISEVNRVVQVMLGLEFYPGTADYSKEAVAKLEELQNAWVARWKDELPNEGFVLLTEGATFVSQGKDGSKLRVRLAPSGKRSRRKAGP